MASWQKIKGTRKERAIAKKARDEGKLAVRSAGSLGEIDVVIIDPVKRIIQLIQSKTYILPLSEEKKMFERNAHLNGTYEVYYEIW